MVDILKLGVLLERFILFFDLEDDMLVHLHLRRSVLDVMKKVSAVLDWTTAAAPHRSF